ncbi:MAG: hypothetical protein IRY83_09940 [Chloroflexi bacterium]|nr:hypothetical protein [Chloroflexota bacterium]
MAVPSDETAFPAYALAMRLLEADRIPFVVGGAWAVRQFAPPGRMTLDLDLMVEPPVLERALQTLTDAGGCLLGHDRIEVRLGFRGMEIDLVHHIAHGEYAVDASWRTKALPASLFGTPTSVAPPGLLIWSKLFIAARHRFDGADILHLIHADRQLIDWHDLLERLRPYPELLLAYLHLFDFCYPGDRDRIPSWLWEALHSMTAVPRPSVGPRICRGPLLDSASFAFDGLARGYQDASLH